jgi:glutamate dehydrogenase
MSKKSLKKSSSKSPKNKGTKRASNSNSAEVRDVKKLLTRHIAEQDRARFNDEELQAMADNFWNFVQTRKEGEAKLCVFNPSLKKEGYISRHTVIMVANDDMPFLVDSITGELSRMGIGVHLLVHPLLSVERGEKGGCKSFSEKRGLRDRIHESWMYIEIDETPEAKQLKEIEENIQGVLHQVRLAVTDWQAMRRKLVQTLSELPRNETAGLPSGEREEAGNFLSWLEVDHFTFLGVRDYHVVGTGKNLKLERTKGEALGILRDPISVMFFTDKVEGNQPSTMHQFLGRKQLVLATKTHRTSVVHRTSPMDAILIKRFDDAGKLIGERLFVGLFTSNSYSELPKDIPLIRSKISYVIEKAGLDPRSHDGKTLIHILNSYPRDELFQIDADELYQTAMGILDLQQRQHLTLFTRHDAFGRFVNCLIFVPRDQYDTQLRRKFQEVLLKAFNGIALDYNVKITDDPMAQILIGVRTHGSRIPDYDREAVERQLQEVSRSWSRKLQDDLVTGLGENHGLKLSNRYALAFPDAYRDTVTPPYAMSDIAFVEDVLKSGKMEVNLYRPAKADNGQMNLKWYSPGGPVSLSKILPLMRHMGLDVDAVLGPYEVKPAGAEKAVWVQDCQARLVTNRPFDLQHIKGKFEEGLLCAWNNEVESDAYNQLILLADLNWREVVVVRAIGKYLKQAGFSYGEPAVISTLAAHPKAVRLIVDLFDARFDPANGAAARSKKCGVAEKQIVEYLNGVERADQDLILRRYLNVIQNILRTNYFQKVKGELKPYVSFKLDSSKIDDLPLPRPMVEIFVYSPRMEGIHLRGGKVARGGIRWSDRREDFRTEILSLMKAQMVKNTVIVPVGSKGGFVVKQPGASKSYAEEGVFCYQTLIRGMLDITDNRKGEKIIPPADVVRYDGDDPYLVVAADKGTAKFSDIANALSIDYKFWLGDAFASGGSAGYDHKDMGITARGAWEAVKRHFREIGKDIQKSPFTVVGVGDMAGDVFGNGMLLSPKILLLGAFNHKHIFLDPEPDTAKSFAERKRLYNLPGSQWSDYDKKLISKGGGVFSRDAKTIKLAKQVRDAFGVVSEDITPDGLIRAMLKARVELLWFGGIGTFIKAGDESHADAGDRSSDNLRVNAEEVQALVIGEGANLGMTQQARIAYARKGGRLNTDAIDNSAGVDTSDHEVNIKILFESVIQGGEMTLPERNKLLVKMTDDVGQHVLRDNYLQTLALSLSQARAAELLPLHARLITQLERAGLLNRLVEFLPDDEEIKERLRTGTGLTRPELAVVMAYAKIALYNELLASNLPENPGLEGDLFRYFPSLLRETYAGAIRTHRLRREIISTFATNSIVNRAGPHFTIMMKEKTGKPVPEIVSAYAVTRDIYALRPLWRMLEKLDNVVSAELQYDLLIRMTRTIERTAEWYLQNTDLSNTAVIITEHKAAVDELRDWMEDKGLHLMDENDTARRETYLKAGIPKKLADDVMLLPVLGLVPEIIAIAGPGKRTLQEAAALYFAVEKRFSLFWLRTQVQKMAAENHWQREAVANIVDDLYRVQAMLAKRILASPLGAKGKKALNEATLQNLIADWVAQESLVTAAFDALVTEIGAAPRLDIAMFTLALRHLSSLIKNGNG